MGGIENVKNRRLVACIVEGTAEKVIITKLLEAGKLVFSKEELLEGKLLKSRSGREFESRHLRKSFNSKITVYRILDSRNEQFNLSKLYQRKIDVINVITAPEIEILVIIKEGKLDDFYKYKSKIKPSTYCKEKLNKPKVKSEDFVEKYFSDVEELEDIIREYKSKYKKSKHKPSKELFLADILKQKN